MQKTVKQKKPKPPSEKKEMSKYNVKVLSKKENELLLALIEGEDKEKALKRIYSNTMDWSRQKSLVRVNKIMEKTEVKKRWEELQELMREQYNRRLSWNIDKSTDVLTSLVMSNMENLKTTNTAIMERIQYLEKALKAASTSGDKDKINKEIFKLKMSNKQPTGSVANILSAVAELNKLHKLYVVEAPTLGGNNTPKFSGEGDLED